MANKQFEITGKSTTKWHFLVAIVFCILYIPIALFLVVSANYPVNYFIVIFL